MRRVALAIAAGALAVACTFVAPLDYLQSGGPLVDDGGPDAEAPRLEEFATGQALPNVVALDDKTVFWHVAGGGGAIFAQDKTGGTARKVSAAAADVEQIVVASDALYWAEGTEIKRAPKGGGASAVAYTGQLAIAGFAVDDTAIYVIESDANSGSSLVARASKTGADAGREVLDDTDSPNAVAVDAKMLYWADGTTSEVHAIPKGSAPDAGPRTVYGNDTKDTIAPDEQLAFAIDGTAMYWTDGTNGIVAKHLINPGASGTTLFKDPDTTASDIGDVAIDATYVWFTKLDKGSLYRVPKAGGAAEVRAEGQAGIAGFASDGTSVYFAIQGSGADGKILRIPAM